MRSRYDLIAADDDEDEDESQHSSMPCWVRDIYKNACPHQALVDRLKKTYTHLDVSYSPGECPSRMLHEGDDFVVETYGTLGITHVWVKVGEEKIEIYSHSYEGGWRPGPWWPLFAEVVSTAEQRRAAEIQREARQREAEISAERAKNNNLFAQFVKKVRKPVF